MRAYKDTNIYKLGEELCSLGNLLMDENASMEKIIKQAHKMGLSLQFRFVEKGEQNESN